MGNEKNKNTMENLNTTLRIGQEKLGSVAWCSRSVKFLNFWRLTVSHQEQVPGYYKSDSESDSSCCSFCNPSESMSGTLSIVITLSEFYAPCQTFLFLSLKPTRTVFRFKFVSNFRNSCLMGSDSFSLFSAVRRGVSLTKASALSCASRGARPEPSSFQLSFRTAILCYSSLHFTGSERSTSINLYPCFNFHLPCFFHSQQYWFFSPQVFAGRFPS